MKFNTLTLLCLLLGLLVSSSAVAQSKRDLKKDKAEAQFVRNHQDIYYFGEGTGATQEEANRQALVNLMSSIVSNIRQSVRVSTSEQTTGRKIESSGKIDIDIETSTGGLLTNTKSCILSQSPEWTVFRYVEKKEVEALYDQRRKKVNEYVGEARRGEEYRRIDDALRFYYWAFCLLKSFPNPDDVMVNDRYNEEQRGIKFIPERLDDIFRNLYIQAGAIEDDNKLNVMGTYKGEPITSLEFTCSFGPTQKTLFALNNGRAQIKLPAGFDADEVQVDFEYEFEGKVKRETEDLRLMVERLRGNNGFTGARQMMAIGNKKQQKAVQKQIQASVEEVSLVTHAVEVDNHAIFNRVIKDVMESIHSRKYEDVKQHFTSEGYRMFQSLIAYGYATLIGKADVHYYESARGRVVCRSIPMNFEYKNNHRVFSEDVTFTFNPDGKIESLAFGLDNVTREAIFNNPADWSDSVRMAITTFLENYKTAYALKDYDYIRGIFDDYAVIIVGREFMRTSRIADQEQQGRKMVEYTQYNKEQYLERLKQQFRQTKFINLHFTDVDVKQMAKGGDSFGIRIKQDYFSSVYSDTGYLFLIVDMNEPSEPLIKVRTWQPDRDPKINSFLKPDNPYYGLITEGYFDE